jgi:hypothetical protein
VGTEGMPSSVTIRPAGIIDLLPYMLKHIIAVINHMDFLFLLDLVKVEPFTPTLLSLGYRSKY